MALVENLAHEYFSSINPIAKRIMDEQEIIERMYGDDWKEMTPQERDDVIDSYLIDPLVAQQYADIPEPEMTNPFPKLKLGSGEKIIVDFENDGGWTWTDEHSGPFCWETKSQLDMPLFESEEETNQRIRTIERPKKPKRHSDSSNDGNKTIDFPWKPEKSIWDSPFLALDRGDDYDFSLPLEDLDDSAALIDADENSKESDYGSRKRSRKSKVLSRAKSITEEAEQLFANFKMSIALGESDADSLKLPDIEDPNAEHMYAKIPPPSLLEPKYEDEPQYLDEANYPLEKEEEVEKAQAEEPRYKNENADPPYNELEENVEPPYDEHDDNYSAEPRYNELDDGNTDPPYNELDEEVNMCAPVAAPRKINLNKTEPAYNELDEQSSTTVSQSQRPEPAYNELEEVPPSNVTQSLRRKKPEPPYNVLEEERFSSKKTQSLHRPGKEPPYNVLENTKSLSKQPDPPYNVLEGKPAEPIRNQSRVEPPYNVLDEKIEKFTTHLTHAMRENTPYKVLDEKIAARPTAAVRKSKTEPQYNELVSETKTNKDSRPVSVSSILQKMSSKNEPAYNVLKEKEPAYANNTEEPPYALHEQDYSAEPAYALYDARGNEPDAVSTEPTYMLYERASNPIEDIPDPTYVLYDSGNPYMNEGSGPYMNAMDVGNPYMNAPGNDRASMIDSEPLYDVLEVGGDSIYENYCGRANGNRDDDVYCPVPMRKDRRASVESDSSTTALLHKSPALKPHNKDNRKVTTKRYNNQGEESVHLTSDDSLDIEDDFLRKKNARANIKSDTIKSGFDFLDNW
ncbi:uncharacterized protein LOC141911587 [Tubulanus polymorphus]|uniref:uncharacterized protein LOC141911587 n=1 Tax=Tubulanus polymorphus TaxID=672921 RepID=UPI003DA5D7B3